MRKYQTYLDICVLNFMQLSDFDFLEIFLTFFLEFFSTSPKHDERAIGRRRLTYKLEQCSVF